MDWPDSSHQAYCRVDHLEEVLEIPHTPLLDVVSVVGLDALDEPCQRVKTNRALDLSDCLAMAHQCACQEFNVQAIEQHQDPIEKALTALH